MSGERNPGHDPLRFGRIHELGIGDEGDGRLAGFFGVVEPDGMAVRIGLRFFRPAQQSFDLFFGGWAKKVQNVDSNTPLRYDRPPAAASPHQHKIAGVDDDPDVGVQAEAMGFAQAGEEAIEAPGE